jgi:uncharacterized membrane protein
MMGFGFGQLFGLHSVASIGLPFFFLSLLSGLALMLALYMTKSASPVSAHAARVDAAIEIVRGRFARGEIDADEYNRLVTGLSRTD